MSTKGQPPITAVVTGATRGLGVALARGLAMQTAFAPIRVVLTARDENAALATAAALSAEIGSSAGGSLPKLEAYPRSLDVSSPRSVANFVQYAEETLGGVDLLVNNAAMCEEGWSRETVQRTLRTNVVGPAALSQALLPGMMRRRRGHVICISSGDGELVYLSTSMQRELQSARSSRDVLRILARAMPPHNAFGCPPAHGPTPAYAVSKAALNALTRLSAAGLPPPMDSGVRVSAVCPGDVLTRMLDRDDELACRNAVPPSTAARDVVWLATVGLLADAALPTGRFWRHCHQIEW